MLRVISCMMLCTNLLTPFQLYAVDAILWAAEILKEKEEEKISASGEVYFSLELGNEQESNIPRFMTFLLHRYKDRESSNKPSIRVTDKHVFLSSPKVKNTTFILTELAFNWNFDGADSAAEFKAILQELNRTKSWETFLEAFLEKGDWIKTKDGSEGCLHRIYKPKKNKKRKMVREYTEEAIDLEYEEKDIEEKSFTFLLRTGVEIDFSLSEITHIFMPLTPEEAA